jgi:saccharopine dehydrogenase-like NADP-dependent oxidoreductase
LADKHIDQPSLQKLNALPHYLLIASDARDTKALNTFLKGHPLSAIISSLPYYYHIPIAQMAAAHQLHYFDLTEDVKTTQVWRQDLLASLLII